ncbi:bifunctional tRNA (5-methylaminomethyl-2-thiouridylate)-methyltransferase MnmD/FAD-dependent cmnm(5)s(2)U34 oxidoreductase MnmC [Pasteurellaceae bacterium RH1A]|nr:bifunctional tRNA (5-methylaminomethyl-2-thiouridylate)-methyltransferase MnmD/FAD-dependent cmnm(5)s(2)U34 oxidoreductase MnmC [Pasteurellaceae bacterium RH1A]
MPKLTFANLTFNASNTPVSEQFDDIYFSTQDGLAESTYVFLEGNQLWEKWQAHQQAHFVIAETGFGTGLNFFAVRALFEDFLAQFPQSPLKRLYFISFEKYPLKAEDFQQVHRFYPQFAGFSTQLTACWQPTQPSCQRMGFGSVYLDLWFGDMADNLPQLGDSYLESIDCWFLDGFSPDKNPQMWNETLYSHMFRLTKPGGSFATFTAASAVRRGLQAVGFEVMKRKGFGRKREMIWGLKPEASPAQAVQYPYFFAKSAKPQDIAIVGGGIASLFVALSLLERGKQVTLYCKDEALAQNASGNQQGAIYPQLSDDDERNSRFYVHAFDYALQRLRQLEGQVDFEQSLSGVALVAYNQKTADKLAKIGQEGWPESLFHLLKADELSQKIGLSLGQGGAFIERGGWLSPIQFVTLAFAYLETLGLKIVLKHEVKDPTYEEGLWCWQHKGQAFKHEALVLANGHCIRDFAQTQAIPFYSVRGQVSQTPTTPALQKLKAVVCYDGYLTPVSASGYHCLGASHVRDNQEREFSLAEHEQNFAKLAQNLAACDWAKDLDRTENRAKVGIRTALRDRIPMVGAVPNFEAQRLQYGNLYNHLRRKQAVEKAENFANLYLVGGLGSRGLTTAPLLGEILACLICNEPLPISQDIWQALSPNRTWMRKLLKGSKI